VSEAALVNRAVGVQSQPSRQMKSPDNGYVGIGIYNVKRTANFGALIRTARVFGADFVFSVGNRNPQQQSSVGAELTLPLFHFPTMAQFIASIPVNARLVCVELTPAALAIKTYQHPPRAVYLLGPEDGTLPDAIMRQHDTVILPGAYPLNVAMAATVVLYDRVMKT
jgi:tRNA G18 (ribose-2'-O)-methylase SpoU